MLILTSWCHYLLRLFQAKYNPNSSNCPKLEDKNEIMLPVRKSNPLTVSFISEIDERLIHIRNYLPKYL